MKPRDADRYPFPRWEKRFWEIVPGALAWSFILLPIVLSFAAPVAVTYFIILFDLYWLFRSVRLSYALILSYRRLRHGLTTNWSGKLEDERLPWRSLLHVVVFPFYNEDFGVLESSIRGMAAMSYDKEHVILIIAAEGRAGEAARQKAEALRAAFAKDFRMVFVAIHPEGLPGEVRGKGPNITWAMERFEEEVVPTLPFPAERIIVHSIDSDSVFHPQHFAQMSYAYLTEAEPTRHIYQFIPLYHNNLWDAPAMMRVIAFGCSFWLMTETTRPWRLRCFAVYAMALSSLRDADYWDRKSIIEDGVQYWRHFFAYDGEHSVIPVYSPVYMDAVLADTYVGTYRAQYIQLRRWAWGASDLALVMPVFMRSPEIPWHQRLVEFVRLIDNHFSWATAPLLLIFAGWLPLLNTRFLNTTLAYNLPRITSAILSLALMGLLVSVVLSVLLLPRPKRYYSFLRRVGNIAQWALLPIITLFSSLPAIDSQTRLMLGKRMDTFDVTPKKRRG